jgi:signal transduction histidine kinase
MSGAKRKVEELGGHVLSAAVSDVVARTMSAAVGRYEAHASVDDQLERLRTLAIMVHSTVEAAEDVHIRSWWLRRWLWTLRDAALDADEVLRLFRQQRAAEETDTATRQAWRALRSVKSMLFRRDDKGIEQLSRMVARLEREAMSLGDFLKLLDLEIRTSLAVVQPAPPVQSSEPPVTSGSSTSGTS